MTKDDLLKLILVAADDVDRVFDHAEIARWPSGAADDFAELGLLRSAAGGMTAPCPNCLDGHSEPITIRAGPDGRRRFFIWCPESLRVEVQPDMCSGWEVDPDGLARAIASAMDLKGAPKVVVPGRFWRLGRTPWKESTRQVVLARLLGDDDAPHVARHVGQGGRDIVLVPHQIPDDRLWRGRVPAVVALSRVTTVSEESLVLDTVAMVEMVAAADTAAHTVGGLTLSDSELKSVIRRQIKAQQKAALTDDAIVAAYKVHGTARATEAALHAAGYDIDHSTIARKVKKAEEAEELRETRDSPSVSRSVASQRRDRKMKFLERQ